MYYKIISDGQIVDASDSLRYVRWQEKNRIFLSCEESEADGIVTSDGADIYLLLTSEAREGYRYAIVADIGEEEYLALREELDAGQEIADDGDAGQEGTEAKTRLRLLEEQVAALAEVNDMLTECLLEMSEIVYG